MPFEIDQNRVRLIGKCRLEDVEGLREVLHQRPDAELDLSACTDMHTGVLQVLLASKIPLAVEAGVGFYQRWLPQYFNHTKFNKT